MQRTLQEPINLANIPVEMDVPRRPGVKRQLLSQEPSTGAKTRVFTFPPGYRSKISSENDGRMEYHTSDEEQFVLSGVMSFGRWYDLPAFGYCYHPAYWLHPADQQSRYGWTVLMKSGADPVDFNSVHVSDWDGQEYFLDTPEADKTQEGVTRLAPDALPWDLVKSASDPHQHPGFFAKTLYQQTAPKGEGWTTWLMWLPPKWRSDIPTEVVDGGDEVFVLSGDAWLERDGTMHRLTKGSYYSDPDRYMHNSFRASESGCTLIRWTRGDIDIELAAPNYPALVPPR